LLCCFIDFSYSDYKSLQKNNEFFMQKIIIYTTTTCPYCVRAKALLDRKSAIYQEINAEDPKIREAMVKKAGGRKTVPQIFIGDFHVGGCDDLYALDRQGQLDEKLLSQ
jgi:glutaredoxin 3